MEKTNNLDLKRKLSVGTKIGYGMGNISDGIAYDWVTGFFIYFLTDFAGIDPLNAGLITMIAVLWDAITDPIIGTLSDRCKSKYGRRRPFIIGSALPLAITMILMFKTVPFEGGTAVIYYLAISLMFWTAYTAFNVPFFSLAPALSFDEDERRSIRGYSTAFMYVGAIVASFLPLFLIGIMTNNYGYEEGEAWLYVTIILSVLLLITIFIAWRSTRGKEIVFEEPEEEKEIFRLRDIWVVLKCKPVLYVYAFVFIAMAGISVTNMSGMYFVASNLGKTELEASAIYLTNGVAGIIITILLSKFASKFDKRYVLIGALAITSIAQISAKFLGVSSIAEACILEFFFTIGSAGIWLFAWAFTYDTIEIEEFKSGKRREGIFTSYQSFINKAGGAAGSFIGGLILSRAGYIPTEEDVFVEQTAKALDAVESMYTSYPGYIFLITLVIVIFYPVTRKRYNALERNLELKREGKEYTTEGFEELLK